MFRSDCWPDSGALVQGKIPQGAKKKMWRVCVGSCVWRGPDCLHCDQDADTQIYRDQNQDKTKTDYIKTRSKSGPQKIEGKRRGNNYWDVLKISISQVALEGVRAVLVTLRGANLPRFWIPLESVTAETHPRPECRGLDHVKSCLETLCHLSRSSSSVRLSRFLFKRLFHFSWKCSGWINR